MRRYVLACALLVACGGAPPLPPPPVAPAPVAWPASSAAPETARTTPDAPFREHEPEPGPAVAFVPPKIERLTLTNGIRVLLVQRHELPLVSVRLVITAGAGDLPGVKPGLLSFVGAMLEQGTLGRNALAIEDAYEAIGAVHGAWVDWDSAGGSVKVLSSHLSEALDLLADVTTHPAFPEEEVARLRARRLAAIAQEKNRPDAMWANAAAASVYGRAHVYGHSLDGEASDVEKVDRGELVKAYGGLFAPSRASLVVAGDVTPDALKPALEKAFGGWRGAGAAASTVRPKAPKPGAARIVLVDRPGSPQSVTRLAEVGVPRGAPDRDAIVVMNTILGGMFSSRINLNLREAHAYTYGAGSRFQMRHGAGLFTAGGSIISEKTAPAVSELLKEVTAVRDKPVEEAELAAAKDFIKRGLPGRFETVTEVTSAVADLVVYGLPLDEYATLATRLDKIRVADVQKAAKQHLTPGAMEVVVVGDRAKIGPELEALHLGPVEVRDAYGDPVAP